MIENVNIVTSNPFMWQRHKLVESKLTFMYSDKPDPRATNIYISNVEGYLTPEDSSYLLVTEPPEIMEFNHQICARYRKVIGPDFFQHSIIPNHLVSPPLLPNFVGVKFPRPESMLKRFLKLDFQTVPVEKSSISEILASNVPKRNILSVIVSHKDWTPLQKLRHDFVEFLRTKSEIEVEYFGEGNSIQDKYDSLRTSKWNLAIENSRHPHYFSEKFTDGVLSGSHSFYLGAPNISEYFTSESYTDLPLQDFDEAFAVIRQRMEESESSFDFTKDQKAILNQVSLEGWLNTNIDLLTD